MFCGGRYDLIISLNDRGGVNFQVFGETGIKELKNTFDEDVRFFY
ncbi:MAG: hypothetical protein CM15mP69_7180 [Ectothiorhodospiraceae bacterium]|nr:MAG: hypothetical protein CM15mP69_7180 [Ectothiorhodospiraceae bacterium]